MKDNDRKGKTRQLAHFAWLPLLVALLFQYALTAPMIGSADKSLRATHADAPSVTYEVTISPDGQVLASSAREDDSGNANKAPEGSAAEAFLQAASGDNGKLAEEREPLFESVWSSITRKAAEVKLSQRQAKKEQAEQLRAQMWANRAQVLEGLKVRGYDINDERKLKLVQNQPDYTSNIEFIDQDEILPAGCEIVALTVALHSMGYDKAKATEIADKYVEYGGNQKTQYTGSPYEDGGGFPPCIVDAANKWLKDNGGKAHAYNLTGSSFESICALVELGYPVLIWTTEDMQEPYVGESWYQPEHCVVLYGLEKKSGKSEKGSKEAASKEASSVASSKSAASSSLDAASKSAASDSSAASSKSAASSSSAAASKSSASSSSSAAASKSSASSPESSASKSASNSSSVSSSASSSSAAASKSSASSSSAASSSESASSNSASSSKSASSSSASSSKSASSSSTSNASSSAASSSAQSASKSASNSSASAESGSKSASSSSSAATSKSSASSSKSASSKSSSDGSSSAASKSAASDSSAAASKSSASSSSAAASKSSTSSSSAAASKSSASSSESAASKSASSSSSASSSASSASSASSSSSASSASSSSAASKGSSQESKSASSSDSSSSSSAKKASPYAKVLVSDSEAGLVKRDYEDFKRIYELAGKRALFIQPE